MSFNLKFKYNSIKKFSSKISLLILKYIVLYLTYTIIMLPENWDAKNFFKLRTSHIQNAFVYIYIYIYISTHILVVCISKQNFFKSKPIIPNKITLIIQLVFHYA